MTCETKKTVYGVGTHKFSQKTKEMFANFVSKKDHGDRFLGQGGCASGEFPRTWFNNKLGEILGNIEKVKRAIQNKHTLPVPKKRSP